jgi:outer membrane autotransporter protein
VTSDVDDYSVGAATISFQNDSSMRARGGLRLGADFQTGGGTFTPFIGLHAYEELGDDNQATFTLGQTLTLRDPVPKTHGELSGGASFTTGRLEAFVRGELDFGKDYDGKAVRAGVRIRF